MKSELAIAKKYAQACIKVFEHEFGENFLYELEQLCDFFSQHEHNSILFRMHYTLPEQKEILKRVFLKHSPHNFWGKLLDLLERSDRLYMIFFVVKSMRDLYREKNKIIDGVIEVYPYANPDEIVLLKRFFKQKVGYTLDARERIEPLLIAGVKIRSDRFLWERSVRKRLNAIKHLQ